MIGSASLRPRSWRQSVEPVDPRHQDVEHDEVGQPPLEGLPGGGAVGEGLHPVALAPEREPHRLADRLLVVHDGDQPLLPRRHDSQHGTAFDRPSRKLPATPSPQFATNVPRPGRRAATWVRYNQPRARAPPQPPALMEVRHATRTGPLAGRRSWRPSGPRAPWPRKRHRASPTAASSSTPTSPDRPDEVPAVRTDVRIRVTGPIARVAVTQEFLNPTAGWLEGVYVFPLPEGAAVDAMRLQVGRAGDRGPDPGARGGPPDVPAGPAVRARRRRSSSRSARTSSRSRSPTSAPARRWWWTSSTRRSSATTRASSGSASRWSWAPATFPAPTPIAGAPGTGWGINTTAVPDAERITPPVRHPSEGAVNPVRLTVELDAGFPLKRLVSPYHPIVTTPVSKTAALDHARRRGRAGGPRLRARRGPRTPARSRAAAVFTEWHGGRAVRARDAPAARRRRMPPGAGSRAR